METKRLYIIDTVLIVATLLSLIILIGYSTPRVISPIRPPEDIKNSSLLSLEETDKLALSKNLTFENKEDILLKDKNKMTLEPGEYFLKIVRGDFEEIRSLDVRSKLTLMLLKEDRRFFLVNAGKVPIDINIHDKEGLLANLTLSPTKLHLSLST